MNQAVTYESFFIERGLHEPKGISTLQDMAEGRFLKPYIYWPSIDVDKENSLAWALDVLSKATTPPPSNYLPILPVDDASVACVVCRALEDAEFKDECEVVRWHLGDIDPRYQGALLDTDVIGCVKAIAEELQERLVVLNELKRVARRYHEQYVEKGVRPKSHVLRPVQLACQNVIIGLAAIQHDATFDSLRVKLYQTCEVPHLATFEADRAMTALLLCDAFQNGGTMELRFGTKNHERQIPASLRRFGRSLDLSLGVDDPSSISPDEARALFLAVTPIPDELRVRSVELFDRGVITPERLCYILMSGVWKAIELDYLVAVSSRVASILEGGTPAELRYKRLAEIEVCRAALMVGMLHSRMEKTDSATYSDGNARIFEDSSIGVDWNIREDIGVLAMTNVPDGDIPWSCLGREHLLVGNQGSLILVPRGLPTNDDCRLVKELREEYPSAIVALVVPIDMADVVPEKIPLLLCPDRLGELDSEIERRLGNSRVGRL